MLILQRTHQYPNSVIIRAVPQILPSFPVAVLFLLWHAKPLTALPIWSATSPCIPFAQTTGARPIAGLQVYVTWVTCPDPPSISCPPPPLQVEWRSPHFPLTPLADLQESPIWNLLEASDSFWQFVVVFFSCHHLYPQHPETSYLQCFSYRLSH